MRSCLGTSTAQFSISPSRVGRVRKDANRGSSQSACCIWPEPYEVKCSTHRARTNQTLLGVTEHFHHGWGRVQCCSFCNLPSQRCTSSEPAKLTRLSGNTSRCVDAWRHWSSELHRPPHNRSVVLRICVCHGSPRVASLHKGVGAHSLEPQASLLTWSACMKPRGAMTRDASSHLLTGHILTTGCPTLQSQRTETDRELQHRTPKWPVEPAARASKPRRHVPCRPQLRRQSRSEVRV